MNNEIKYEIKMLGLTEPGKNHCFLRFAMFGLLGEENLKCFSPQLDVCCVRRTFTLDSSTEIRSSLQISKRNP